MLRFAILRFCECNDFDTVVAELTEKRIKLREARSIATKAREQIATAADTDRRDEIGLEKIRLDKIYEAAIAKGDYKIAMNALKERARLLGLTRVTEEQCDADRFFENSEQEEARQYLESLELFENGLPFAELCRMAAKRIIELTSGVKNLGE